MIRKLTLLSLLCSLSACTSLDNEEVLEQVEQNRKRIESISEVVNTTPDVILFEKPYVALMTREEAQMPSWTHVAYQGTLSGTLEQLVEYLLRPYHLNIDYVDSVKKDKNKGNYTISVGANGTMLDAVKAISTATGYAYVIDENKVSFQKFLTESFPIIANAGDTTIEFQEGTNTSQNGHIAKFNSLKQIEKEVRAFLRLPVETAGGSSGGGGAGAGMMTSGDNMPEGGMAELIRQSQPEHMASVDEATGILTVKATPAEMVEIRKMIKQKNEYLSRKVKVEVEMLNVEFNDINQSSVDFDLVKAFDSGATIAEFASSAVTNTIGAAFGTGAFKLTDTGDSGSSTLLVEALQEQGRVTTEILPVVHIKNNNRGLIKQTSNILYISDRPSSSTSVAANAGVKQEELEVGFTMELMPSVVGNTITMKVRTTVKSLTELKTKGEGNQAIESPETRVAEYFTDVILKSGELVLFTRLSESSATTRETKSGWGFGGFGDKLEKKNSEKLLLIRATVI